MDSGDESEGSEEEPRRGRRAAHARSRPPKESRKDDSAGEPVDRRPLLARVNEVRAFSDILRLAPTLKSRSGQMQPKELAAAVTAAARVKFYDADVFQSGVLPAIRRYLVRSRTSFTADEATDILFGLGELNVYDEAIFGRVVESFAERKQELEDPVRRGRLLAALKKTGHKGDKELVDYLAQRAKAERYDAHLKEMNANSGPQIYYGGLRK